MGSTGSIGIQALQVMEANPDEFEVEVLTAFNNSDLLISQAKKHKPNSIVIGDESDYQKVFDALESDFIKVFAGEKSIAEIVELDSIDIVLTAIVGYAGLLPTINAIKAGKRIALANKETLVVAGELVTKLALEHRASIIPVDSEHSAIFQCLTGEDQNPIEKIILTASGGPFRGKNHDFLSKVTYKEALKHPNWDMGDKITIDSATMMNKGLEVIEAKWLFALRPEQIEVVVHQQSIIHSLVQFQDGSIKAQMGLPDMKLPIQFALSFPRRLKSEFERFDFLQYPCLNFEKPDTAIFRNLDLAYEAMRAGGNMPCILNAANEEVVKAFLNNRIGFMRMADVIETVMQKASFCKQPGYEDYVATNEESRIVAKELISN